MQQFFYCRPCDRQRLDLCFELHTQKEYSNSTPILFCVEQTRIILNFAPKNAVSFYCDILRQLWKLNAFNEFLTVYFWSSKRHQCDSARVMLFERSFLTRTEVFTTLVLYICAEIHSTKSTSSRLEFSS